MYYYTYNGIVEIETYVWRVCVFFLSFYRIRKEQKQNETCFVGVVVRSEFCVVVADSEFTMQFGGPCKSEKKSLVDEREWETTLSSKEKWFAKEQKRRSSLHRTEIALKE